MAQQPPGDDWIGVTEGPLPVAEATAWAVRPDCGAVVTFCGTVRDHSEMHDMVQALEYEAYEEGVLATFGRIASDTRRRWPHTGRVALLHRTGRLALTEVSVVTVVSSPHRAEAFEAGRWCIDTLKAQAPIWKREHWPGGSAWAACHVEGATQHTGDGR